MNKLEVTQGTRLAVGALFVAISGSTLLVGCGDGNDETSLASGAQTGVSGSSGAGGSSGAANVGGGGNSSLGGGSGSGGSAGGANESGVEQVFAGTTAAEGVTNMYGLAYSTVGEHAGKLYASGIGAGGNVVLVRFEADGSLDDSFGEGGIADTGAPGNTYGVVELASGDVIVQGNGGGEVFLVKLSSAGTLDATFGRVVALGWDAADVEAIDTACASAAASPEDTDLVAACTALWPAAAAPEFAQRPSYTAWDIHLDTVTTPGTEKLVVFAAGSPGKVESGEQRSDSDRWVTRLLASDGSIDTGFNAGSPFSVDVAGLAGPDNSRRGLLEADGSMLSSGYTDWGGGNNAVLVRLLPDGTPDGAFGFDAVADPSTLQPGLTRFNPFVGPGAMAEVYSVVKQESGRYVTTGYGVSNRDISTIENDLVSFGVVADGLDETWSDAGALAIQSETDQSAIETGTWEGGRAFRENGRDLVLLPDGRTFHVGCYNDFASVFVVERDGGLDESFGEAGRLVFDAASEITHTAPFFAVTRSADGRVATTASGNFLAIFEVQGD